MDQGTDPVTGRPATPPVDTTRTSTDPDRIADDIRETRAEMNETMGAIGDKLDPHRLANEAKEAFASSAQDAGASLLHAAKDSSLMDTIKQNPIPAAAVGLSVAWFLSKMGESETERYRRERFAATGDPYYAPRRRYVPETYGDYAYRDYPSDGPYGAARTSGSDESLADKASDAFDSAKDTASDLADQAKDAVTGSAHDARDRARGATQGAGRRLHQYEHQAASWLERQMYANPLAVGAVAAAAGALVGLSIPETTTEDRLLGEQAAAARDRLGNVAGQKLDQAKNAAQDVADEAASKAKSVGEDAKSKAKDVADDAQSKAKDVADSDDSASKASSATGSTATV